MNGEVWMIGLALSAALAGGVVQAQVTNGDFNDGLTGWTPDGDVTPETTR